MPMAPKKAIGTWAWRWTRFAWPIFWMWLFWWRATAVMGHHDLQSDYMPLKVDYEERFYAAGNIIGSRFIRREGRPSEEAILAGRLVDRTIRPLFDSRLRRELQVVVTTLSYDEEN